MSMIRDKILERMNECDLTIYQVAQRVVGQVRQRTVYTFLRGEKDAGTKTASVIMEALGLKVTWKKGARAPRLKAKSKPKRSRRSRKEAQDGHRD